jgi:hypothetical protein
MQRKQVQAVSVDLDHKELEVLAQAGELFRRLKAELIGGGVSSAQDIIKTLEAGRYACAQAGMPLVVEIMEDDGA